jgi:hypothetical protein
MNKYSSVLAATWDVTGNLTNVRAMNQVDASADSEIWRRLACKFTSVTWNSTKGSVRNSTELFIKEIKV